MDLLNILTRWWNLLPDPMFGWMWSSRNSVVLRRSNSLFRPRTLAEMAEMSHFGGPSPGKPLCEQKLSMWWVGLRVLIIICTEARVNSKAVVRFIPPLMLICRTFFEISGF